MSNFQSPEVQTNFLDSDGVDLGKKLITKDYLISVYPSIAEQIGIPPELWVWGHGSQGAKGTNATIPIITPVTTFAGGSDWKHISCGLWNGMAIKIDGTLWVWGRGNEGQLGNNAVVQVNTPTTTFAGGNNWKEISSGGAHTAAIKTDGTLWIWGQEGTTRGTGGKLGTNNSVDRSTPVTTFAGGTNWKQVSCGGDHTAAIKTDGTLWTWGLGVSGQLGNNTTIARSTPVTTFAGGTNWKSVSCGGDTTAAIKADGTLWVWGLGAFGQLGTNDAINRSTPVTTFAGGTNWRQVDCGGNTTTGNTVAIKTDGTLWVWGSGSLGRLGTNNTIARSTPVTTFAGGTNWKSVSCGADHTVALKTNGTLWAWGSGASGRLGANNAVSRSTPVTTFTGGTNWKRVSCDGDHTAALQSTDF